MILDKFKYKLFGRFKGRKKVKLIPNSDINKFSLKYKIEINSSNYNILDIGSGSGENAIYLSKKYPHSKIIACDLFEDGNINLYNQIIKQEIKNIDIFRGNILEFLDIIKVDKFFDEIWILFPDPWPKRRHHKRRLINIIFLKKIHAFLKKNSQLMIASDSKSYIASILSTIYSLENFYSWENQRFETWNYIYLNLAETKFFKKAKKSDRNSIIFRLKTI